jgi:hypothetical protein
MKSVKFNAVKCVAAMVVVVSMLSLSMPAGATPIGTDTELITNGGFESGGTGWTFTAPMGGSSGTDVTAGHAHTGSQYNLAFYGGSATQEQTFADGFAPNVNSVVFDGWAKGEQQWGQGSLQIDIYTGNMSGGIFTQQDHQTITYTDTRGYSASPLIPYIEFSATLTVDHGAGTDFTNYVKVVLASPTSTGNTIYFDDISLKSGAAATPEPGTLVLLAAGLLGLLAYAWRKRR